LGCVFSWQWRFLIGVSFWCPPLLRGSIIPIVAAPNPSLTIAALAERIADRMARTIPVSIARFEKPQGRNVALLLATAVGWGVLLLLEGYGYHLRWFFLVYSAAILVWDLWVAAFTFSFLRLCFLAVIAGLAGYVTQLVGVSNRMWTYAGPFRSFHFVPFMFVLASVAMYGLARYPLTGFFTPMHAPRSRWANLLLAALLIAAFWLDVDRFPGQLTWGFRIYYLFLTAFLIYGSRLLSLRSLSAVVGAAWIVGFASEFLGAKSDLWTFSTLGGRPPLFLVFASWPMEFFLHYALSGIIAGESLDTLGAYAPEHVV
jgi:hypothetical protein